MAIRLFRQFSLPAEPIAQCAKSGASQVSQWIRNTVARESTRHGSCAGSLCVDAVMPLGTELPPEARVELHRASSSLTSFFGISGPPFVLVEPSDAWFVDEDNSTLLPTESGSGIAFLNLVPHAVNVRVGDKEAAAGRFNVEDLPENFDPACLAGLLEPGLQRLKQSSLPNPTALVLFPIPVSVPVDDESYAEHKAEMYGEVRKMASEAITKLWWGKDLFLGIIPAYIDLLVDDDEGGELVCS